ncbi:response regulator transcription factor [Anaerosacchariphilus polymeriproducens]|uniref:Stage 0 sporulation protein A homolog n=1 Tax=Anaerosacchariphilus polymeriproducens TaxID=1812858 RepID=A0A371ARR7_9FIRM|nr:response regulator transcription factor [Anaerosacchariphilus polymeriproducens]RDU22271.1 DNA-binding response regulator [Anaerosacchariphilus polymeriproducens]
MRLLFIEDDEKLCEAVTLHLKNDGYEVDICTNGEDAEYYLSNTVHDVIILDRMLPGIDGMTILKNIRNNKMKTPVIMVTAMGCKQDKIEGLDSGADDYLVKPYDPEELLARIRALLRRPRVMEEYKILRYMDLELNTDTFIASCGQIKVSLTKKEEKLLEYFLLNKNQILTRKQILDRVWGLDNFVEEGNIDNYIFLVRRRLKALNTKVSIKTLHGVGYRMEINADD